MDEYMREPSHTLKSKLWLLSGCIGLGLYAYLWLFLHNDVPRGVFVFGWYPVRMILEGGADQLPRGWRKGAGLLRMLGALCILAMVVCLGIVVFWPTQ